jgi:hypothetical protein
MGLLDFLKSSPSTDAIANQVRKAKEHYAQPDYRRMAMDKLLKWDTDESIKGLLERFTVVVQSPHWDEEEKCWLVNEVVTKGERMVPILRDFIFEKNEVNHAIIALKKLVTDQESYSKLLTEALAKRSPSDHRSVQSKREIIGAITDLNNRNLDALLVPYLEDHSDDVQSLTIEALAKSQDPSITKKLPELLSSEVHSARVLRMAAKVVTEQKIPIEPGLELAEVVAEEYAVKNGYLVRLNQD